MHPGLLRTGILDWTPTWTGQHMLLSGMKLQFPEGWAPSLLIKIQVSVLPVPKVFMRMNAQGHGGPVRCWPCGL